jgi:hypothetical protein
MASVPVALGRAQARCCRAETEPIRNPAAAMASRRTLLTWACITEPYRPGRRRLCTQAVPVAWGKPAEAGEAQFGLRGFGGRGVKAARFCIADSFEGKNTVQLNHLSKDYTLWGSPPLVY